MKVDSLFIKLAEDVAETVFGEDRIKGVGRRFGLLSFPHGKAFLDEGCHVFVKCGIDEAADGGIGGGAIDEVLFPMAIKKFETAWEFHEKILPSKTNDHRMVAVC